MATKREIELLLRADDEGAIKTLKEFEDRIAGLDAAQKKYAKSTDVASESMASLRDRLRQLEEIGRQLVSRQGLIDYFNRQNEAVAKQTAALDRAQSELAAFQSSSDKAAQASEKQANKLAKLEGNVTKAAAALEKAGAAATEARSKLESLGITDVAAAQAQIQRYAAQTGASIRDTTEAIGAYTARLERQQAAERATGAAAAARAREQVEAANRATAAQERLARAFGIRTQAELAADRAQRRADVEAAFGGPAFAAQERENAALERQRAIRERLVRVVNRLGLEVDRETAATSRNTGVRNANTAANAKAIPTKERLARTTDRAARSTALFAERSKTALSTYQRLRGQVLALASAYIGVYQAIDLARRSLEVTQQREAAELRLGVANDGDARRTGEDLAFVRQEADRLGQSLTNLSNSYSRFRIAGDGAKLSLETQRQVFTDFTETATVLRLSQDETAGVFRALEQSFSKGKIQAEELRGQLGDRLPGAFTKMAEAIGVSVAELDELIEKGEVSANLLPLLGELLADEVALRLPEAVSSFQSNIGRLNTAFEDFLVTVANSGFRAELEQIALSLTAFFKSEDGLKFANELSNAFRLTVRAIRFFVENAYAIRDALLAIIAIRFAFELGRIYTGLIRGVTAMVAFARAATTAGTSVRAMGFSFKAALGPIGVLLAVATEALLYFALRTDEADGEVSELAEATKRLEVAQGDQLGAQIRLTEAARDEITLTRRLTEEKKAETLQRLQNAKARLAELQANAPIPTTGVGLVGLAGTFGAQRSEISRLEAQVSDLDAQIAQQSADINRADQVLRSRRETFLNEQKALAQRVQTDLLTLEVEFNDERNQARLRSDEGYLRSFKARFNEAFQQIGRIEEQNRGEVLDEVSQRLSANFRRLQGEVLMSQSGLSGSDKAKPDRSAETRAKRVEAIERQLQNTLAEIRKDALDAEEDNLEARLDKIDIEIDQRIAKVRAQQDELRKLGAGDEADAAEGLVRQLEVLREINVAKERAAYIDEQQARIQKDLQERYEELQKNLNTLIETRDARVQTINTQQQLGLVSEVEAVRRARDVQLAAQADILAAVKALQDFIANSDEADLSKFLNIDATLAGLERITAEAKEIPTAAQAAQKALATDFAAGAADAFGTLAKGLAGFIEGVNSIGDAFKNAGNAFLNFLADFLVGIGQAILKAIILEAILRALKQGSGGSFFDVAIGALGGRAGRQHSGGIVSSGSLPTTMSPMALAAAVRYHSGGIAGLAPDEVPTILKAGEEVLTESDPRHRFNGGMSKAPDIKIINAIDSASVVSEGMNSKSGQRAILNFFRANKQQVRTELGL